LLGQGRGEDEGRRRQSDLGDKWDADSDASGPAMYAPKKRLMQATSSTGNSDAVLNDDDDVAKDLIEKEKRKELESLAQLGREHAKR
jgi:hypothetical protein